MKWIVFSLAQINRGILCNADSMKWFGTRICSK